MSSLAIDAPPPAPLADADRHPWSIRIGRILGIPIDLHVTFLVLLAWLALTPVAEGASLEKGMASAGFTTLVFATVVLHELGHAIVARRFGCETRRILLLPIGGVASLARMPQRPIEELLVALAGPAVNVVLAIGLAVTSLLLRHPLTLDEDLDSGFLVARLFWVNVGLCVFNLLPAFPMDGGRALRALLATSMDRVRATSIAAGVGRALAVGLGILGLVFQPMLALVAIFVWSAGRMETAMETAHAALAGISVRDVMSTRLDVADSAETFGVVAERLLGDRPHDVVVTEAGRLAGVLTRGDLLRGLARGDAERSIATTMHRSVVTADPSEPVEDALTKLGPTGLATIVVIDRGAIVGVVDATTIGDRIVLDRARSAARRSAATQRP
jgi:Zn-dependent protease/predicted transcriptional regulator